MPRQRIDNFHGTALAVVLIGFETKGAAFLDNFSIKNRSANLQTPAGVDAGNFVIDGIECGEPFNLDYPVNVKSLALRDSGFCFFEVIAACPRSNPRPALVVHLHCPCHPDTAHGGSHQDQRHIEPRC